MPRPCSGGYGGVPAAGIVRGEAEGSGGTGPVNGAVPAVPGGSGRPAEPDPGALGFGALGSPSPGPRQRWGLRPAPPGGGSRRSPGAELAAVDGAQRVPAVLLLPARVPQELHELLPAAPRLRHAEPRHGRAEPGRAEPSRDVLSPGTCRAEPGRAGLGLAPQGETKAKGAEPHGPARLGPGPGRGGAAPAQGLSAAPPGPGLDPDPDPWSRIPRPAPRWGGPGARPPPQPPGAGGSGNAGAGPALRAPRRAGGGSRGRCQGSEGRGSAQVRGITRANDGGRAPRAPAAALYK